MGETQWNIPPEDPVIPQALLDAGCSPLLSAVLYVRGVDTPEKAGAFLELSGDCLSDPLTMADMSAAVARLRAAIAAKEHVAVYGDYDVDGITSSCMLTDYLRGRGVPCELYIPDRMEEGYGVNAAAVRTLREKGVSLLITVDCGVTAVEETAYAASLGMDMIITDHHECRQALPAAAAVVDPKRADCGYQGGTLAGVGVAFKLLCAMEGDAEALLDRYADLVAVGTVADVMPLTGENRYIVRRGLEKLEQDPCPGLRALLAESGMGEKKITSSGVGFTLAPRLNASGRLGRVGCAVELLLTDSERDAAQRAEELCRMNRDRQTLELNIWRQAREKLGDTVPEGPIVLAQEGWHQGVIGIAASRLTEAYSVPAIMICLDGDNGKGSCRSFGGFNLFEALSACAQYLEGFGGHALAAGLTIRRENIPAFREAMTRYYHSHPPLNYATLDIDLRVNGPELLRMDCVEDLERMEPCGAGNPRPLLCLLGARLTELVPIGGGRHLRVRLERFGQSYEAVWFSHTAEETGLHPGDWVDAAFYPQINLFRGHKSVQLLLCAMRAHTGTAAEQIMQGTLPDAAGVAVPVREDFALVWRALAARGGHCDGELAGLAEALAPRMREETLALTLKVFEELGLLRITSETARRHALRIIPGVRADLETSRLLQRMRAGAARTAPVPAGGKG